LFSLLSEYDDENQRDYWNNNSEYNQDSKDNGNQFPSVLNLTTPSTAPVSITTIVFELHVVPFVVSTTLQAWEGLVNPSRCSLLLTLPPLRLSPSVAPFLLFPILFDSGPNLPLLLDRKVLMHSY